MQLLLHVKYLRKFVQNIYFISTLFQKEFGTEEQTEKCEFNKTCYSRYINKQNYCFKCFDVVPAKFCHFLSVKSNESTAPDSYVTYFQIVK